MTYILLAVLGLAEHRIRQQLHPNWVCVHDSS